MATGILFQVLQLYRICKFATETTVLDVILPGIAPEKYFDDRLADTLDAIFDYGIGNLEILITQHMIQEFNVKNSICHNDTTSASTYGNCDKNRTSNSIEITFGYSKKHRQDLKQLVWSLSVSSDSGFPLFQKAYSGNTADVHRDIEQPIQVQHLYRSMDFLLKHEEEIQKKVFWATAQLMNLTVDLIFFDTTNTYFEMDGKYLLSTSDKSLSVEDIALGYKQLMEVERAFRTLKSTLSLRPVYHTKDDRIQSHVMLCQLALLLVRVTELETGMTWPKVRSEMERLHLEKFLHEDSRILPYTELTNTQRKMLKKTEDTTSTKDKIHQIPPP